MKESLIAMEPTFGYKVNWGTSGIYASVPTWLSSSCDRVVHHIIRDKKISLQLNVRKSASDGRTSSTAHPRILAFM